MANFCNVKKIAMEERLFNELLTTILTEISTKITLPWREVVEIVRVLHKLRSEIE